MHIEKSTTLNFFKINHSVNKQIEIGNGLYASICDQCNDWNPAELRIAASKLSFAQESEEEIYGKHHQTEKVDAENNEFYAIQALCKKSIILINDDELSITILDRSNTNLMLLRLKKNIYNGITLHSFKDEEQMKKLLRKKEKVFVPRWCRHKRRCAYSICLLFIGFVFTRLWVKQIYIFLDHRTPIFGSWW
jgi:hypothetical protein